MLEAPREKNGVFWVASTGYVTVRLLFFVFCCVCVCLFVIAFWIEWGLNKANILISCSSMSFSPPAKKGIMTLVTPWRNHDTCTSTGKHFWLVGWQVAGLVGQ